MRVENKRGQIVSPLNGLSASAKALETITLDPDTNSADLIDYDADGFYPLTSFTYLLISANNNSFSDCIRQREVLKARTRMLLCVLLLGFADLPMGLHSDVT